MSSTDGARWSPWRRSSPARSRKGRRQATPATPTARSTIETTAGGFFALLPERGATPRPGRADRALLARRARPLLAGRRAARAAPAVSYRVTLSNRPLLSIPGRRRRRSRPFTRPPERLPGGRDRRCRERERALGAARCPCLEAAAETPAGPTELGLGPLYLAGDRQIGAAPRRAEGRSRPGTGAGMAGGRRRSRSGPEQPGDGNTHAASRNWVYARKNPSVRAGIWPATTRKGLGQTWMRSQSSLARPRWSSGDSCSL